MEKTAIQFLLTQTNASEYEDVRDETTMRWDTIAYIMEEYHNYKIDFISSSLKFKEKKGIDF